MTALSENAPTTTREELHELVTGMKITRVGTEKEERMRTFLHQTFIPRIRSPETWKPAFEGVDRIRHIETRPDYRPMENVMRINLKNSPEYGVLPRRFTHELIHALHCEMGYFLSKKACEGRNNKAKYYNGGFPHFDFGGKHPEANAYMMSRDGSRVPPGATNVDEFYQNQTDKIEKDGLRGNVILYPPGGFTHPTDIDSFEALEPEMLRRKLIREANCAWYRTANLMADGYEKAARNSVVMEEYSATNAQEMLAVSGEVLFNTSPNVEHVLQLFYRQPWLAKRLLDVLEPSPEVETILSNHGIKISEWQSPPTK